MKNNWIRIKHWSNNTVKVESWSKHLYWMFWLNKKKKTELSWNAKIYNKWTMNNRTWTVLRRHSRGFYNKPRGTKVDCPDQVYSAGGSTSWDVAKVAQGRVGKQLLEPRDLFGKLAYWPPQKKVQLALSKSKNKKGDRVADDEDDDAVRSSVSQDQVAATLCTEDCSSSHSICMYIALSTSQKVNHAGSEWYRLSTRHIQ